MDFLQSKTFKNLSNAFAGESQARNRYTFYASVAKNEGHQYIQSIFAATADNEKEHAKVFFKLLIAHAQDAANMIHVDADYPLAYKNTLTNLRAAAAGEKEEWTVLYSQFSATAKQEGFNDVAVAFAKIAEVEQHHEARFTKLADELQQGTLYKKTEPTQWVCANCGYVHEGPEAPEVCPACAHPVGYFFAIPEVY
ncbi:MAG: rubrerythrin family protein [Peptococcaceae bacterium]|nr:rubrerythrin family protein [Peptococcaceae bacterium]